jgi:hypothetical protein
VCSILYYTRILTENVKKTIEGEVQKLFGPTIEYRGVRYTVLDAKNYILFLYIQPFEYIRPQLIVLLTVHLDIQVCV